MDQIRITGIRAFGHHGVLAHEREFGQEFGVDVEIGTDFGPAAATDDLARTVDYGAVAALVVEEISGPPADLIETLSDRIADRLIAMPHVREVTVTVHKPHAPMPVGVADVTVSRFRRAPTLAYLGLGSNLGDSVAIVRDAVDTLADTPGISVVATSSLYLTDPVGGPDQPDFVNAVVAVRTAKSPHELLAVCRSLEQRADRVREERWGPRSLDVDIIDIVGRTVLEPDLQVPHQRASIRGFVVVPLAEIAPDHRFAGVGPSALELSAACSDGVRRGAHLEVPNR